jgi:hypothetical protein
MKNRGRKTINEVASCLECVIPKTKVYTGMIEKCKTGFNNVTVFTFYGTVC